MLKMTDFLVMHWHCSGRVSLSKMHLYIAILLILIFHSKCYEGKWLIQNVPNVKLYLLCLFKNLL